MQDLKMFITYHCEVSLASKETVSHFPSVPEPINSMSELTKNICAFLSSHSPRRDLWLCYLHHDH